MNVLNEGTRVPIKAWTDLASIESEAKAQLANTANLPFVFKHVAVMPDVHYGKGATVGSVIATRGAICPAAVGVDIGCGMMAMKLGLKAKWLPDNLSQLRSKIEEAIPVGFNQNTIETASVKAWAGWKGVSDIAGWDDGLEKKAIYQMGSLGGGNHFIEICLDTEDHVWIMLHSGSRYIGKTLAERHITKAKGIMKKMFIDLPDEDLAYFAIGTPEFKAYIEDVKWCQEYAAQNRREMMSRVLAVMEKYFDGTIPTNEPINCHHNYVAWENHFGTDVMVTRKGAVRAREGDMGIIPGSMGTCSYIVRGKGNPDSFCSCSHGAGRRMSRTKAMKAFTLDDLSKQTAGVECRKDKGVLDEIPGAYKDIDEVMANQSDLVEIVATLKQVMCIKG